MKNLSIKIAVIALHVILIIWIFSDSDSETKVPEKSVPPSKNTTTETVKTPKTDSGTTKSPQTKYHKYVVKKGDNLSKIAQKFKTTVPAIMEENGLTSPNIHPGKQLVIKK